MFFKLDFSFPFLNHRNGIHSLQINTDVCMKLFLIARTCAVQRLPTVTRAHPVVSCVYSCRIFKNKYEVIFFLITYFFHLTKYRLPTQETCTSAHHRGEQPLVLRCCDLFKRSTVRLPPVSRKSRDASCLSTLSYRFLGLLSRGLVGWVVSLGSAS